MSGGGGVAAEVVMFSVTGPAVDEEIVAAMEGDFYGLVAVGSGWCYCICWKLPVKDEEPPVKRKFAVVSYSCRSSAVEF